MTSDRKKPGVAFWATVVVVVVLVAYPLSFGPACWISSRVKADEKFVNGFYQPVLRMTSGRQGWLQRVALWYSALGVAPRDGSSIFRDPKTDRCHWTYAVP
jgi:hypothetical protein